MATWCKACSTSDATTDTVKVNMPVVRPQDEEEATRCTAQQEAEEAARLQAEAEAEAERARARMEAEARRRAEEEEARAREEERLRAEAAAAEERQRKEREEQQRRAEEAARAERQRLELEKQAADRAKAEAWLKKKGFGDACAKKKSMFSSTYPLHVAVKENDAEMIRCLLAAGADASLKNSSGQTAAQLADKSNKKGSHSACLDVLGGVPVSTSTRARGGA